MLKSHWYLLSLLKECCSKTVRLSSLPTRLPSNSMISLGTRRPMSCTSKVQEEYTHVYAGWIQQELQKQ